MPRTSQARQASRESSMVQQPRLPVRRVPGIRDSARWTPPTSCAASTARAAATAEATPPPMAATTRTCAFSGLPEGRAPGGRGRRRAPPRRRGRRRRRSQLRRSWLLELAYVLSVDWRRACRRAAPKDVQEQRVGRELALLAPLLYRRADSGLNRHPATVS